MINREISIPKLLIGLAVVMLISVADAGAETPSASHRCERSASKATPPSITVTTGGGRSTMPQLIDPSRLVIDFEDTKYEWRKTPLPGAG